MPGKARGGVRDFVRAFGATDSAELRALREEVRPVSPETTSDKTADMWSAIFGSSEAAPRFASEVSLSINGKPYTVGEDVPDTTTLNSYLREVAHLPGTKFMCYEGGCGACVVAATVQHPVTATRNTFAVNSCLVPIFACHGWEITTVEGIGDRRSGYHKVQASLAHFNGTQCGFCSPGMVMNMYSLLEGGKAPSMSDVENSFGGNLCRCTGYRPILDAFKSLASDATPQLKQACVDIEDVYKVCSKTGKACSGNCKTDPRPLRLTVGASKWMKVRSLAELFAALEEVGDTKYKLVAGNTAEGVYRSSGVQTYVDVKDVTELRTNTSAPSFSVGGNVPLSEVIVLFNDTAATPGFQYLKQLATHLDWVANVPVRNVGTLAGNLSIKHAHPEFPSDVFTTFEAVGATLNIAESASTTRSVRLLDYLQLDMNKKVIVSISLPALDQTYRFRSFKITPRAQNAHAYVNAGFLVKVEDTTNWKVVGHPRIVFGGINPNFVHATNVEGYLTGKNLLDEATVTGAMAELGRQLLPDSFLPDASPEYRKGLSQALFYKFLLSLDPSKVSTKFKSGGDNLERPLSSGVQDFDTDKSLWPLNQPVPKIEAMAQCSGEAEYINDIPSFPDELHGAFVLTRLSSGTIARIDASAALASKGVVAFFQHSDVMGPNNFTPPDFGYPEVEEIFCSGQVRYAGQVAGLLVAENRELALAAVDKVVLEYSGAERPVLTIGEVLRTAGDRIQNLKVEEEQGVEEAPTESTVPPAHVIKGQFEIPKQHHLHMETHTCLMVPTEEAYDVFSSCQWMDLTQCVVARTLGVPASRVNMVVRRLGGGYGGKISRAPHVAAACAVAVRRLNRPVRIVMTMQDNLEAAGKRFALRNEYEVAVDATGKIESLKATIHQDSGYSFNDSALNGCLNSFTNCYDKTKFKVEGKQVRTDTASNTWCRAPGTTEGVAFIEEVMEHIAHVTGLEPLAVRLANMAREDNPLPALIDDLKIKADYETRKAAVEQFNAANRWKKRGMALVPMQYRFGIWGNLGSLVSIYQIDGSVAISHGGIEMGQGLNTKVAQVAAHILGVPLSQVSIKPSNSMVAPNAVVTGGSLGSEAVAYATKKSCEALLERLKPVREGMTNPTWLQLVKKAHGQNIDLSATYMFTKKDDVKAYNIWGATIAEVEVDILTGEKQVLRVDLVEDVGQSLSPMVDVGQIEGAFVMGMGYWLSEELIHDPTTGRLLNTRTWNYKVPGAKDIPIDFRIYFRKNAPNPVGVLNSKATGEPPLNMSVVCLFAMRNALDSARRDAGEPGDYHQLKPPATTEHIFLASKTQAGQFKIAGN